MHRFTARLSGRPAIIAIIGAVAVMILLVACGGDPPPTVEIERIECPSKLSPGEECNILGRNLDLITEMQLGQGSLRVPVSQRGSKSLLIITVPLGVTPGAYIIYYQTREDTFATGRTVIVSEPPGSTSPPPETPEPTTHVDVTTPPATLPPTDGPSPPAPTTIVFADLDWKTAKIQNAIVRFIIENGYVYQTLSLPGDQSTLWGRLIDGSVDVYIEAWTGALGAIYDEAEENGKILALGKSLDDSWQSAFVVPTYVIEGDPARGIEPMAPGLKTPQDILKHQDLFVTPATAPKARLVTCLAAWVCAGANVEKVQAYGLEDAIELVDPGTGDDLFDSLETSYARREPWMGYIWGPSQPAAELDLTLLEEPEFSPECWATDKACAYAIEKIRKAVHPGMMQKAPGVVDFLRKWRLDGPTQVEAEAYSGELGVTIDDTAAWYLQNKEDLWAQWVTPEAAVKVKEALQNQ